MGLDINGVRFLLYCRKLGIGFEQTAMIGRLGLSLSSSELKTLFKAFGYSANDASIEAILNKSGRYAEELLRYLGATDIHSYDYSDYEGASHIHDMNVEIPAGFKDRYTAVLDCGTLEHVFNFPLAIKSCMEMVKVGGYYLAITPTNNFMGHGFYQFSPELFFSVFSPSNGYELVRLIAFEDKPSGAWYEVTNPSVARARTTLVNSTPTYLLVIAKKIARVSPFRPMPLQSDYVSDWQMVDPQQRGSTGGMQRLSRLQLLGTLIPSSMRKVLRKWLRPTFHPRFFTPMNPITDQRHIPRFEREHDTSP